MKNSLLLFLLLMLGLPLVSTAQVAASNSPTPLKSNEQRLQEIERKLREFEIWYNDFYLQGKERVSPFLGERVSFGGFFETAVTHIDGPDMTAQTSANSQLLGINIAAEFNDKIRFVTQFLTGISYTLQNIHNNPSLAAPQPSQRQYGTVAFGALVAHGYVEYRKSEMATFQTGIGYAPFGIAFQNREPVLLKRRSGPQITGASDATTAGIAFPLWMGVHMMGSQSLEKGRMGYNLYTFSLFSNPKTLGGGARLWWSDSQSLTLGVSAQAGDQGTRGYFHSYGADVKMDFEKGGVVAEYGRSVSSGLTPVESYYVEPFYNLADGEWVVYAAADYINNPIRMVGAVSDPYEVWRYGVGVNWLPIPTARFRAGILSNDYVNSTDTIAGQERDYYVIDLSAGIAF